MKNLSKKTIKLSVLILILSLIFSFTSCRKKAEDPYLVAIKKYNEVLDNISNYKFIPDDIKHQKDDDWKDYDLTLTGQYEYALLNIYNSNIPVMIVEAQVNHDHMIFQNNPVMVFAINPSNNEVVVSESFYKPNTPDGFGLTTIGNGLFYYYFGPVNGKGECVMLTFENGKFVKDLVFDGLIGEDLNSKDFEFFDIKNREPINRLSSKKNRYSGKLTEPKMDFSNIVEKRKKEGKKENKIILDGKLEMYTKEEILKKYPDSKGVEAYFENFEDMKKVDPNFEFKFCFLKLNSPRKISVTDESETKKEVLVENIFLLLGVAPENPISKKGMNAFIMVDENDFEMTDYLFFAPDIPTVESDSLTIYK